MSRTSSNFSLCKADQDDLLMESDERGMYLAHRVQCLFVYFALQRRIIVDLLIQSDEKFPKIQLGAYTQHFLQRIGSLLLFALCRKGLQTATLK